MSGPEAVRTLLWYLNHLALQTDGYVVLHAGAVALDGRGVVLPAEMDVGKSTLVTALVRDGFGYLSDEFGPIGLDDGLLRPYPSPIGLDPGSFPLFPDLKPTLDAEFDDVEHWHVPVAPGWPPGSPGVPVEVIVFPSYTPGSPCSVTPVGPTEAVALVANNTLNFFDLGGRAFRAVSSLVRDAEVYRLIFGDLGEACAMIRGVVTSVGNRDQGG